jgi:hypothetical protein
MRNDSVSGKGIGARRVLRAVCVASLMWIPGGVARLHAGVPDVPEARGAGEIVGVNIQNVGPSRLHGRYITFGQVFAEGAVGASDGLVGLTGGRSVAIQASPLALWPDGSIKLAAITMQADVPSGSIEQVRMAKGAVAGDGGAVDVAAAQPALSVTLDFSSRAYAGRRVVDLGAALERHADYWFRGPLASQARVDVPVPGGPLHMTADVTVYRDGTVTADVQFNNDLTSIVQKVAPALPPLVYTATITLDGRRVSGRMVQWQYQDWHYIVASNGRAVVNVQHDPAYLEHAHAILPYDLMTGVSEETLNNAVKIANQPGFGMPLSANGVDHGMPDTGGRPDIGYTTLWNTAWLMTGDWRAAAVALAQGDAGGAVPWNIKLSDGHWLTPAAALEVWTDARGNPTFANDYPRTTLTNTKSEIWELSTAHEPNLAYVPYIMTAERWYLDRLNAQAAWSLSSVWPAWRCARPARRTCDIVLNGRGQVRAQAWELREVEEAAFVGYPGTFEEGYFQRAVADNYRFFRTYIEPAMASAGSTVGWVPDEHWRLDPSFAEALAGYDWGFGTDNTKYELKPWMNDFLTGVVGLGALMGFDGAKQVIDWERNWLAGRFLVGPGNNPRDGADYDLIVAAPGAVTWGTLKSCCTNGASGWVPMNRGYYPPLARASLNVAITLFPEDGRLREALRVLEAAGATNLGVDYFRRDPTYNVGRLR